MKKFLIISVAVLGLSGTALAQEKSSDAPTRAFSAEVGAVVENAMEEMNKGQHARALPVLSQAKTWPNINAYELATIEQMRGAALYELGDNAKAIEAFKAARASGGLLPEEDSNLMSNIAQLKIANGDLAEGAQILENWAAEGGTLNASKQEMLMHAWIQADDYERALPYAEAWFAAVDPKTRKHYDLLNFLYKALGQNAEAAEYSHN